MTTNADRFEAALLDVFWCAVCERPDVRLRLLVKMAELVVPREAGWDLAAIREAARGCVGSLKEAACFVCGRDGLKLYLHHVIQVQNGGSNDLRNHVPICLRCHSRIHPWLPEERPGEEREFVSIAEWARTAGR
jgi:5-methylcytosine-specific restriction endonuclease McrA